MFVFYNEEHCRQCVFARPGSVTEPIKEGDLKGIKYVECLRDNEGVHKEFARTISDKESDLWSQQIIECQHCIYNEEQQRYPPLHGGDKGDEEDNEAL